MENERTPDWFDRHSWFLGETHFPAVNMEQDAANILANTSNEASGDGCDVDDSDFEIELIRSSLLDKRATSEQTKLELTKL